MQQPIQRRSAWLSANTTGRLFLIVFLLNGLSTSADEPIRYAVGADVQVGDGRFAPYYFTSNTHGLASTKPNSGYLTAAVSREADDSRRFDYAFGAELATSYANSSAIWIQQLYASVNRRALFLSIGSREYPSVLRNDALSSGSLVWSGNARPIPQIRFGLSRFVAVPYTAGWLQLKFDGSYGRFTDNSWLRNNYGYYNDFITTGAHYHQKSILFRSKESMRLVVTVGGEFAAQFGGHRRWYTNGMLYDDFKEKTTLKDYFTVLFPSKGGDNSNEGDQIYYYGNHIGAWHLTAEYKLAADRRLKGYFEWLFDDGSGIGKLNGGDGLWGLEYVGPKRSWLDGLVAEYLQTTNQSGPIHWAPDDFPGTLITPEATGADNYYNNYFYNGWAHHGLALGSPLLRSPIYNGDGYLGFTDNRVRAFHVGASGHISPALRYRIKASYRKGWGTPFAPLPSNSRAFASLVELSYAPTALQGWSFTGRLGLDRGNSYTTGNSFGAAIAVVRTGLITK